MELNYSFEIAGFFVCLLMCIATFNKSSRIDLKDRVFIRMLRVLTVFSAMGIVSSITISNNMTQLPILANVGIYLSISYITWFWTYFNDYLCELATSKNVISVRASLLCGFPSFISLIMLVVNIFKHNMFEVVTADGRLEVTFNSMYFMIYVLVGLCVATCIGIMLVYRKKMNAQTRRIVAFSLLILIAGYYIQYNYKTVMTLGFCYSMVILLTYLYVYNYNERCDGLTGLFNDKSFVRLLNFYIGNERPMSVAMVTLNDFKYINQEYGYEKGNLFLEAVGAYLDSLGKHCTAFRCGSDRFAVVIDENDREYIEKWAQSVLNRFDEDFHVENIRQKLSARIAIVQYPDFADDASEIVALLSYLIPYSKKHRINTYIICDDNYKKQLERKLHIASVLQETIQGGNLYVEYQPIYDVEQNAYTRGEALFRLDDSLLGDISPEEFFPIAEEQGFVVDIGYLLIEKVCQYIKSFEEEGGKPPIISINFSRQQLMADGLPEKICNMLDKYNLRADSIAFELPNEVFSVQYDKVKERIEELHDKGFRFYLDAFGGGFDLSPLMELPLELIKINRNMICEAAENDTIYLLVSAIIAVFEEKGIKILGDGIESEQLKTTSDMLIMHYLQGAYFSEPAAEQDATALFRKMHVLDVVNAEDTVEAILSSMPDMGEMV